MMAGLMLVGVVTTLACREPEMEHPLPQTFAETVIDPFVDFMKRDKAVLLLLFVLFFKLGDSFAGSMTGAYYVDLGYSNSQIAEAAKLVGSFSTLIGLFLGGLLIYRLGIFTAMLILAVLQGLSTGSFILLGLIEPRWGALAAIVGFEDLSSGMGTAALVAFMTLLANKRYTATQYALLSSLATSGRTFFAGFSGVLTQHLGYEGLYLIGAALALPGIVFLLILRPAYADSMQALQGSGEDAESQGAGGG
ncbi:MAG: MFS transporter, partial [Acidobacteriota bacterium]